ncbi:MAG: CPBP family intramembrane glutamic endopeptidase [Candidatus Sericytochromatia bacterium]
MSQPTRAPFEAVKARHILGLWLGSTLITSLGLVFFTAVWAPELLDEEVMLLFWLAHESASLITTVYFSRRIQALGIPWRRFMGGPISLPPQQLLQLVVMGFLMVWGWMLLPHLQGFWRPGEGAASDMSLLWRPLNTPYALSLNLIEGIAVVVLAPVIEEILFRGLLLHRLAVKWGLRDAIWISALIFGLLHGFAPGIFLLGLTLTLVYLKTGGSLYTTILLHALHNFLSVVAINGLHQLGWAAHGDNLISWMVLELFFLSIAALMYRDFLKAYRSAWSTWPPFLRVVRTPPTDPLIPANPDIHQL